MAPESQSPAAAAEGLGLQGGGGGTSSLEVVAIVCGVLIAVGIGTALLCCVHKRRKDKRRRMRDALSYGRRGWGEGWGDTSKVGEGGRGGGGDFGSGGSGAFAEWQRDGAGTGARPISLRSPRSSRGANSRAASIALVATFEGGRVWHETEDGQGLDLELGSGAHNGGGDGGGGRGHGLRRMGSGSTIGPRFANPLYEARMNRAVAIGRLTGAAATASPSAAGDDADDDGEEEVEGEEKAGFFVVGGGGGGGGGRGGGRGSGTVATSQAKVATTTTTTPTTDGSRSVVGRGDNEGSFAGGTMAAEAYRNPDQMMDDDDDDFDDDDDDDRPRRLSLGHDGSSRRGAQAAAAAAAGRGSGRKGGVRIAPSPASLATSAVLNVAEGVVASAESLSPLEKFVPGAREALSVVAGLARLAAADHRGDTKDMRQRVRWCQGVVLTLDKARVLLGKVSDWVVLFGRRFCWGGVGDGGGEGALEGKLQAGSS